MIMQPQPKSLDELFREEEETALSRTRAEIAREDAAWRALPKAERDRQIAERERRFESMFPGVDEAEDDSTDDDDEEE